MSRPEVNAARVRVAQGVMALDDHRVYSTREIAALVGLPPANTGGFLAGMARRHQLVERVGKRQWRRRKVAVM